MYQRYEFDSQSTASPGPPYIKISRRLTRRIANLSSPAASSPRHRSNSVPCKDLSSFAVRTPRGAPACKQFSASPPRSRVTDRPR